MGTASKPDPIPEDIRQVVALFDERADTLRFPDVDREVLMAGCEGVWQRATAVEHLRAELETAKEALEHEQTALRAAAKRALAYASIYAETDEALSARISSFGLAQKPNPVNRQRRGTRTPKRPQTESAAAEQLPGLTRADSTMMPDSAPEIGDGALEG
ncbi:MAG: hypothetical protein OEZ06_12070 [Myxococcales bacterium]|nr:hypothetical protein [Myxococcales bacterium]